MAPSPFLDPGATSSANSLALLHLKRDMLIPTVLDNAPPTSETDYAEGKVANTRFGSFPHSTLIDQPWGSQILASNVDTGSRGGRGKKRKREGGDTPKDVEADGEGFKGGKSQAAEAAKSGFIHLVPPTPEAWTLSLPHRTQVVYTPDYSYILQKLRARPGDHIIEAGAGSGSFTHAAARAVFNGYPDADSTPPEPSPANGASPPKKPVRLGKVYSFEFHEPRAVQLTSEIAEHGLSSVVRVTNRDVYNEGFCLPESPSEPAADCIFLDLPAPWLALKHLTRSALSASTLNSLESSTPHTPSTPSTSFTSPLNPKSTTRICTFSPCIEQVQRTITAMRQLGWVEITMSELQHHRIDVRRERVGLAEEGLRGANASAATVEEAVKKLREVEGRFKAFHNSQKEDEDDSKDKGKEDSGKGKRKMTKQQRLESIQAAAESRNLFKEGRLLHRTEPELKTHTSYLVFAVLPRQWTKEDEERCRRKW
ncbi:tRNA methyltransferase complex GCD14 subunit, partial [Lophium mytilinum]